MYALVAVVLVVESQGGQDSQLYSRSVAVLLNGTNDFDGTFRFLLRVIRFDDFAKSALSQELDNFIYFKILLETSSWKDNNNLHRSASLVPGVTM